MGLSKKTAEHLNPNRQEREAAEQRNPWPNTEKKKG